MTMLAVAPPWTTASTSNLRRTTSVLPITIVPPSSPPLRPLPKQPVNAPRQQTASPEISIASDAPPCPMSRGFPPWRFADAGPRNPWRRHHGPASENLHNTRPALAYSAISLAVASSVGGILRPRLPGTICDLCGALKLPPAKSRSMTLFCGAPIKPGYGTPRATEKRSTSRGSSATELP